MQNKFLFPTYIGGLLGLAIHPASGVGLDEIIVTAQKVEQSSQDVGISITAFNADSIRELGLTDATKIPALSPGVQISYPNGLSTFSFSVRGVTQTDFAEHQEPPVAVYVDEVYVSQMAAAGFQIFDTERVEVLRGPQGTLFGRNATGGLMQVVTRKPSDAFSAYGEVTYGAYNSATFEGAVGGSVIDDVLSARASVKAGRHDGYIENVSGPDGNEQNNYAGRLQLLFDISESAELLLNVRGSEYNQDTPQYWKNAPAAVGPQGLGVFTSGDVAGDVHRGSWNMTGDFQTESSGVSGKLTWDFDSVALTSISDFSYMGKTYLADTDEGAASTVVHIGNDNDVKQFSQELRINSVGLEHANLMGGLYFLDIEGDYHATFALPGVLSFLGFAPLNGIYNELQVDTQSWSIFGQADIEMSPEWTLTGGFRWTQEKKEVDYANFGAILPDLNDPLNVPRGFLAPLGAFNENLNGDLAKIDDGLWSAKAALSWQPTDDLLLFASWNRGVKGGSFNSPVFSFALTPDEMRFDEEVLNAFEAGFKADLFDNRLRVNASGFFYDYTDIQAYQLEVVTNVVDNKQGETKGAEIEVTASPVENLELMVGASYLDAVIEDVSAGLVVIDARPQMAPKWNVSGMARYEWQVPGGSLAILGDFTYLSQHFFDLSNAEVVRQEGYIVGNARLGFQSENEQWEAYAFVRNIGDTEYATWAYDLAGIAGFAEKTYGRPRWWGVGLRYSL